MDRRSFMKGTLAAAGTMAVTGALGEGVAGAHSVLPSVGVEWQPAKTPVKHLVVVMMENRSVDHFLGWYGKENKAYDGKQSASFRDLRQGPNGPMVSTTGWGQKGKNNFHGRGFEDPSHGWDGGRAERRGGHCDGWLDPATGNDEFCLSTYDSVDAPVWAQLVRDYQAYDRWFCSLLGPTQPNRYYLHSAQSGGLKNNALPPELASAHPEWTAGWDWPTLWTLCANAGVTANYYFSNLPELAFWGARHVAHSRPVAEFYADALAGTLPQVSIIDPWFTGPAGLANDDHPHADIRLGQAFLSDIIEAFTNSSCYREGALVVTYDEWGGFWDHVPPPRVADDRGTPNAPGGADDFAQVGFRIPSAIVSPWTRTRPDKVSRVDHTVYEHSSILRFISENWGLPFLTQRQRSTNSIGKAFRGFSSYDPEPYFLPYDAPLNVPLDPILEDPASLVNTLPLLGGLIPSVPLGIAAPAASSVEGSDLHRLADSGFLDGLGFDLDQRFEDSFLHRRPELLADAQRLIGG